MRLLSLHIQQRGMSLVELLIVVSLIGLISLKALPAMSAYASNVRVRNAAEVIVGAANTARTEAIRRNTPVALSFDGSTLVLSASPGASTITLRSIALSGAMVDGTFTTSFDGLGRSTPFGTEVRALIHGGDKALCGADVLCPIVHIEPSGLVTLCRSGTC